MMSPHRNRFHNIELDPLGNSMLELFECAGINGRSAAYVSTPLTTGETVIKWHEDRQRGRDSFRPGADEIIRANRDQARALISRVRERFQTPVIDPVALTDVPGWSQTDYHRFWCALIERYAYAVIFNKGWHLSTGCVAEFATAILTGAELYDDELRPLSQELGIALLQQSHVRLTEAELPTFMLDEVLPILGSGS